MPIGPFNPQIGAGISAAPSIATGRGGPGPIFTDWQPGSFSVPFAQSGVVQCGIFDGRKLCGDAYTRRLRGISSRLASDDFEADDPPVTRFNAPSGQRPRDRGSRAPRDDDDLPQRLILHHCGCCDDEDDYEYEEECGCP